MNLYSLDALTYPEEVEWEIDQNNLLEYRTFAQQCNRDSQISGIIIQHEYGIFGGIHGEHILSFIEACVKPIIVTLHTVLPNPHPHMKEVTARIIERANIIVILTHRSKAILETEYPQSIGKLHVIPHGIHATNFTDTTNAKKNLKLDHFTVLSTFGLLSRGKGIEYVIQSLPEVVKRYPSIKYLILGETHPVIRREEGESYRNELIQLVTQLHLGNHVRFYDQYLSLSDLIGLLQATDIYISPSINPNQAVSGTLSYAMGTGRAVISTAFAQAKEIITPDSGRLVPIQDSAAYTRALMELLTDKTLLKKMHRAAYNATRPMLWSRVAHKYSQLLTQHILPPINLTHMSNMTDDFGLFQFAKLNIPNEKFGYTLDDNARALVICSWLKRFSADNIDALLDIYLHFIKQCQQPDGSFINYIDHSHKTPTDQNITEDLEDAASRAMWALSEVISNKAIKVGIRNLAKSIFVRALPHTLSLSHIRSSAFMIKALANVLSEYPDHYPDFIKSIRSNADSLIHHYNQHALQSWQWFDDYLGYNNAVVPESLFLAGNITHTPQYTKIAQTTLSFLIHITFAANQYLPIGHSDWYINHQKRSDYDQQPEDPASMILALVTAYEITHDATYRNLITICFSWFLGNNSLQLPLYNYTDGGCYDGLHPDRVNLNQGAESLVSYLLSRLALGKINRDENSSAQAHISRSPGSPLQSSGLAKSS